VSEIGYVHVSHRTDASVAGGQGHQPCLEMESANLPDLEEPIIAPVLLRREYERGAVRILDVGIPMQSEMKYSILIQRKSLEARLCRGRP
jgi:hypothetical protein